MVLLVEMQQQRLMRLRVLNRFRRAECNLEVRAIPDECQDADIRCLRGAGTEVLPDAILEAPVIGRASEIENV